MEPDQMTNINERYAEEVKKDLERGIVGLANVSEAKGPTVHRDKSLDQLMIHKSLTSMYDTSFKTLSQLDEKASKDLVAYLSAGVCKNYFKEVAHNALLEVLKCKFEESTDQLKLCARYNRAMGAIELLDNLIRIGD